jgi:hypothetical protein
VEQEEVKLQAAGFKLQALCTYGQSVIRFFKDDYRILRQDARRKEE